MPPTNHRRAVRARIRAARAEAAALLEQRRREVRRDLEARVRELTEDSSRAA